MSRHRFPTRRLLLALLLGACASFSAAEKLLPQSLFKDMPKPPTSADVAASAIKRVQSRLAASAPAASASTMTPPIVAAQPEPVTPALCMRPTDLVNACSPGPQLSLVPIVLPNARLGVVYKPRRLVTGGSAPYRIEIVEGSKPEGLDFTPDGSLAGQPIGPVRTYNFVVHVTDSAIPPLSVRQAYVVRLEQTPPPRPAASAASAPPPAPAVPQPPAGPPHIASYMLLQEELDEMFPKAKPDAAAPAASAAGGPRRRIKPSPAVMPTELADKMQALLAPLVHVDYPTVGLFTQALDARHCAYFQSLVNQAAEVAKLRPTPVELKCVRPVPTAAGPASAPAAKGAASAPLPAASAPRIASPPYAELLPEPVRKDLIALARWEHPLDGRAHPPEWADNGCGCAPPFSQDWSYGVYPFWQVEDDKAQKMDFSLFSRIGYIGAQLSDTGAIVTAMPLTSENTGFTRTARRFGTEVDLVVQRSEWRELLNQPYQTEIIQRAVKDLVAIVDTPMTDAATVAKRYLLPGWDEPDHMFDGVTVFFDNAPTDPAGAAKFAAFYESFMHALIFEMQKTGRPYGLSLIVEATEIGKPGAYNYAQLWDYTQLAQKLTAANALAGAVENDYKGTTDITFSVLALLEEPTSQAKKNLRASSDSNDVLRGHRRVAMLNVIAPVLFHGAGNTTLAGASVNEQQMDDDFAYFKWQFGGMGLWPMPLQDSKTGPVVNKRLAENFSPVHAGATTGLCRWVCPNRSVARFLFMALILTGIVAFGLYHWSCRVRRIGRRYIIFLWLGGVITAVVGLALLSCDPQLAHVRQGNGPLIALLAVVVGMGMYYSLKPRIAPP